MLQNERRKLGSQSNLLISYFAILASTLLIGRVGRAAIGTGYHHRHVLFCSAFVTAAPAPPSFSRKTSTDGASEIEMTSNEHSQGECQVASSRYSDKSKHALDQTLWMYHVESTTSTMDEAKLLVENKFIDDTTEQCYSDPEGDSPKSFIISATSQSKGRGTSNRNWKSNQTGNALFTIGIQQSAWMNDLKSRNSGLMVPLTLFPLKIGSAVASRVQTFLTECATGDRAPRVTVKWPNDVLLYNPDTASHEKVAGILIESSRDWFLIGIGINVGHAPDIPANGVDYGRKATALHKYCNADILQNELACIEIAKQLGRDIAFDLHTWLNSFSSFSLRIGDDVLDEWKSFVDWDMELVLRDTPNREKVKLKQVLGDGRVVVQEIETGLSRTLVSDYFL